MAHVGSARSQSGQAAVELVALLPLVAALLVVAWQLVVAGEAAWQVTVAARAAARAAAIGSDPGASARHRLPRRLERGLRVSEPRSGAVEVSVRIPRLLPWLTLGRAHATVAFRSQELDR